MSSGRVRRATSSTQSLRLFNVVLIVLSCAGGWGNPGVLSRRGPVLYPRGRGVHSLCEIPGAETKTPPDRPIRRRKRLMSDGDHAAAAELVPPVSTFRAFLATLVAVRRVFLAAFFLVFAAFFLAVFLAGFTAFWRKSVTVVFTTSPTSSAASPKMVTVPRTLSTTRDVVAGMRLAWVFTSAPRLSARAAAFRRAPAASSVDSTVFVWCLTSFSVVL